MYHSQWFRGKWPIGLRHGSNLLTLEVTDEVDGSVLLRVIYEACRGLPLIAMSQYVDSGQWKMRDRLGFLTKLAEDHDLEILLTSAYDRGDPPADGSREFIISVLGAPDLEVLEKLVRFGMTELQNMVYGLAERPENWRAQLLEWNAVVARMFRLEIGMDHPDFLKLARMVQILMLTIDGHLFFSLSELSEFDRLLQILETVAQEKGLRLELRSMAKPR